MVELDQADHITPVLLKCGNLDSQTLVNTMIAVETDWFCAIFITREIFRVRSC